MMKIPAKLWQRLLPSFFCALFALVLSSSSASLSRPSYITPSSSDGYIADITGDGLYTWKQSKFPLKVYMKPDTGLPGYKETYPQVLKSCFDDWSKISDGKLSWKQVSSAKDADIVVSWSTEAVEATKGTEAGKTTTFALYNTQTNWGWINRAEMRLLTRLPEREFTEQEIRKAYLHEVGHAFGIAGHSSDKNDIMYFSVSNKQQGVLSDKDIATINYLYQHDLKSTTIGAGQKTNDHALLFSPVSAQTSN